MKAFIVLAIVIASASAGVLVSSPLGLASPLALSSPLAISSLGRTVISAPAVAYAAPAVIAPAVTATQTHAQDELGQYTYSYAGGPSAKVESKTLDGVTRGGYSYVDANGVVQTVNYVSDALGFRVAATNLPVAPAAPPAVLPGPIPQPVQETPEVAAARSAHLAAVSKAAAAAAAAPEN